MRSRRSLLICSLAVVLAAGLLAGPMGAVVAAGPRSVASPSLVVSVAGPSGSLATLTTNQTLHIAGSALDPARQAVLYKGRWWDTASFTGWEMLYYKGYSVSSDGQFAVDELQDQAGRFRYQVCQWHEEIRKGTWVCSPYVEVTVG